MKPTGNKKNTVKYLHIVNFGFTILNEEELAYSAAGNHRIAIFKDTEDYEPLKLALWDIAAEVESLNTIKVNDKNIQIKYCLGEDWNFWPLGITVLKQESHFSSAKVVNNKYQAKAI